MLFSPRNWLLAFGFAAAASAQQVCLPSPRLLTVTPMGGQVGTTVEVTITGDNLDEPGELLFSTPKITAKAKELNKYVVTIEKDAPAGVFDARIRSRLGVSSARAFSVTPYPEVLLAKPNHSAETALELKVNSICNAVMTPRAINYYSFEGRKGQRVAVDCAAAGIDSKLSPVLIVANEQGRDLQVNRTGGALDFIPPVDGKYFVKVHGLTFQGGADQFYRLALMEAPGDGPLPRQPSTRTVSAFSWHPEIGPALTQVKEHEPNNEAPQKITLPCEIAAQFYPAADVDSYEFTAKKGETWWVEVASERLGLPTNPFVLVQKVTGTTLTDVAELDDIPSPMKPSSNGYSYDGPPYDAGSADPLGKVEIKEDGLYRISVRDLFGGTRTDPSHVYRLRVRAAAPDFSLVAWGLHMTLRNGDRNALSKPVALRGGATVALEVVVVRKDGFEGEIALAMESLPQGVTACGLKIPAGKSKGMMLITAADDAPTSFGTARLVGTAAVGGAPVTRACELASMAWPVRDASQEIPKPRLLNDMTVSVSGSEQAPVTIAPTERKTWEAVAGGKLTIPLKVTWRNEFAGTSIKLKPIGEGFESIKELDIPLKAATSEVLLDLATLKTPPGKYAFAFYGPAVTKYRYNPSAVQTAEVEQKKAEETAATLASAAKKMAEEAKGAPAERKAAAEKAAQEAAEKLKAADAMKTDATKRMKAVTDKAAPTDTADIVVSEAIQIEIKPAAK